MTITVGTQLGRYKIHSAIGAGAMGEVFLAEDTKLERKVAIKILPEDFAQNDERMRRFILEAKSASALNHPNIITIHEVVEINDTHFIATEYIEGETLREKIERNELTILDSIKIAEQIVAALSVAHRAHIIHRDIKPENVMIRPDGIVKILDFGIAKLTEQKTEIDAEAATAIKAGTSAGMIIGTANYMSPEQARGKPVDERTDIWSLGICLYEMLSGKQPFSSGDSISDMIAAILKSEPAPLEDDTPAELQLIVKKCLQKDASERYKEAKDLLVDLRQVERQLEIGSEVERANSTGKNEAKTQIIDAPTTAAPALSSAEYLTGEIKQHKRGFLAVLSILLLATIGLGYWFYSNRSANAKQIESIAVMPFVNESGNADLEYLSDGMTESLIGSLSQIPNLNVKARSSVFRYKGKETSAQAVGKELNVQAILNGRVVKRGDDLTLYVELVNTTTENVLWKAEYNRSMANLVSLQSEIARDVSSKLRTRLSNTDEQRVAKTYTTNPEAYQLYLQGLRWSNLTGHGTLCKMRVCENMMMSSNKMRSERFLTGNQWLRFHAN